MRCASVSSEIARLLSEMIEVSFFNAGGGEHNVNEFICSLDSDVAVLWQPGCGEDSPVPSWYRCLLLGGKDSCLLRSDPSAGGFGDFCIQ